MTEEPNKKGGARAATGGHEASPEVAASLLALFQELVGQIGATRVGRPLSSEAQAIVDKFLELRNAVSLTPGSVQRPPGGG